MAGLWLGIQAAGVADVSSAVNRGIRIQQLGVQASMWNTDSIAVPRHRRKVTHAQNMVVRVAALPEKRDNRIGRVMEVHPLEPLPVMVDVMERGFRLIESIEI